MAQLHPQVLLLVWLIHIPALPSEPGAGWGQTFHLPSGLGRQEQEFEGRKIGLGFIVSQSLRK